MKERIKLRSEASYLYMIMTQAAIKMRDLGKDKKDFVYFAEVIWDSMLLSNAEQLRKTIFSAMINDISKYVEENDDKQ